MHWAVGEEVATQAFGRYIALAYIGAFLSGQSLGVATRWQNPVKVDFRLGGDQVTAAVIGDAKPVDFFENARTVWIIGLPGFFRRGEGKGALVFPSAAVCLACHVGLGIKSVFGL